MHILITIIIPTHNSASYINRCLDSIVQQDYKHFEVIIVDNGSIDNTVKLVNAYQNKLPSLQILNCPTGRQGNARNMGLTLASGHYIAFIDSDDYIHHNYLSYLISISDDSDIVIAPFEFIFSNNHKTLIAPNSIVTSTNRRSLIQNVSVFSKLLKRSFLENFKIHFSSDILYEDIPFWAEVLNHAKTIRAGNRSLYYYVQHENQSTKRRVYTDFKKAYALSIKRHPGVECYNNFNILILEHLIYFIVREHYKHRRNTFIQICKDVKNTFMIPKDASPSLFFKIGYKLILTKQYLLFLILVLLPYNIYHSAPRPTIQSIRHLVFTIKRYSFFKQT